VAVQKTRIQDALEIKSRGPWGRAWDRFRHKKIGMATLIIIGTLYLAGIFAPVVSIHSFTAQNLMEAKQRPSLKHPFGTDRLGRDQYSRVVWGIRTTVIITIASVLSGSLLLGVSLGALAGYFGGKLDAFLMRIGEVFLAFPGLLLTILIAATIKPRVVEIVRAFEDSSGIKGIVASGFVDYVVVFTALSAFSWVGTARMVRGQFLWLRSTEFVEAARAVGASTGRIIFRHLLPNAISPLIVSVSMGMGGVAGSEVILSWLGIGIQPPQPSLGLMIFDNFGIGNISILRNDPHLILFPMALITIIMFSWNLLGDAVNDVLNPRTR